jgi:hypothetical protein
MLDKITPWLYSQQGFFVLGRDVRLGINLVFNV